MDKNEQKRLNKQAKRIQRHLEEHFTPLEDRKLKKRAAKLRRLEEGPKRPRERIRARTWEESDDDANAPKVQAMHPKGRRSLEEVTRELTRDAEPQSSDGSPLATLPDALAQVTGIRAGHVRVRAEGEGPPADFECELPEALARTQRTDLAVGDWVHYEERHDAIPRVLRVRPRRSRLARPDPQNPHLERVLVANVDLVVVVAAARFPALRPALYDRFRIAVERGGADSCLCINKLDQIENEAQGDELEAKLAPYRAAGVDVFRASALQALGIDELRTHLGTRLVAFVGHSGVGKSSLVNALAGRELGRTGDVRAGDGKGQHVTTSAVLQEVGGGLRIVDTPGIRAFGLDRLGLGELRGAFPDLLELSTDCRFRDCRHGREPGCGVHRAVSEGHLDPARLNVWSHLLEECDTTR